MDYPVRLTEDERVKLVNMVQNDQVSDEVAVVAMLLLRSDENQPDIGHNSIQELSREFNCREQDVLTVKRLFHSGGVLLALTEGRPTLTVDSSQSADGQ
ncbi:MAG: hypothetical protein LBJ61_10515, partial [Deltaproteobacteria bacterium]|nr:hypothetical protein [Deltaproteobacteria bacterium]